jgi:hypothetical protein
MIRENFNRCEAPSPVSKERFTVTDEHLKLLRSAQVIWCNQDYGAPSIDTARPYGSAAIEPDMARIIGKYAGNKGVLRAIHLQTLTALQIVLCTGKFEAGTYERQDVNNQWRRI